MDKEKEKIQKMLEDAHYHCGDSNCVNCDKICYEYAIARQIVKAGYGNVVQYKKALKENEKLLAEQWRVVCEQKKQAVREFAEKIISVLDEMGMERSSEYNDGYNDSVADCITNIKSCFKELYGEKND